MAPEPAPGEEKNSIRLTNIKGEVYVNEKKLLPNLAYELKPGDRIKTGEDGRVTLTWRGEENRLTLSEFTTFPIKFLPEQKPKKDGQPKVAKLPG